MRCVPFAPNYFPRSKGGSEDNMASTKEFKEFIAEQFSSISGISFRYMMGECVFYYNGVVFGGIYDDRFLVKRTESNKSYDLAEIIPYKNAKPMYMIENVEDSEYLIDIIKTTYADLVKIKK